MPFVSFDTYMGGEGVDMATVIEYNKLVNESHEGLPQKTRISLRGHARSYTFQQQSIPHIIMWQAVNSNFRSIFPRFRDITCTAFLLTFYQRVSIASYASAGIARAEMSVRLSVRHTPVLYQNEES